MEIAAVVVAIITEVVRWFDPAFQAAGYAVVGLAVFLERSIFLGLIVPGDVILALGGVYASQGDMTLAWVIVLGALAASVGESTGFFLGRRYGRTLVRRLPKADYFMSKLDSVEEHFQERGGGTVALGRYATAAGTFVPFVAGMGRMPYHRFLLFDIPSIAVWAAGITLVGWAFGRNLETVDRILQRFGWGMLGLLALYVGYRVWRARRNGRDRTSG